MQERSATKYRIITWHFERCFCKNEVEALKNTVEAELVPIEIWRVWKCKHRKKVSPKDKKSPILCWVFLWGNVLFWKIVFAWLPHRRRACGRTSCCWATPPSGSGWTWRRRGRLSPEPRRNPWVQRNQRRYSNTHKTSFLFNQSSNLKDTSLLQLQHIHPKNKQGQRF